MQKNVNFYKGFDIINSDKRSKLRDEYFNPYGYNLFSNNKNSIDTDYKCTHTNQNNKIK